MRLIIAKDYRDMSRKAANIISAQVIIQPDSVLGLATGATPLGLYGQLAEWYQKGDVDFSACTTINLDEYCGLPPEDKRSYHYYMQSNLFDKTNFDPGRVHIPNGASGDDAAECARYSRIIEEAGPIDIQLLGIGRNAHIGFNEPGGSFSGSTHVVTLSQSTIEANSKYFESGEKVPGKAISVGMRDIMRAKKIVLIASGEDKADAIYRSFFGPVTPQTPASILQLHPDVTVIADEAAMSLAEKNCSDEARCA